MVVNIIIQYKAITEVAILIQNYFIYTTPQLI